MNMNRSSSSFQVVLWFRSTSSARITENEEEREAVKCRSVNEDERDQCTLRNDPCSSILTLRLRVDVEIPAP